jgi:hypothetical protein
MMHGRTGLVTFPRASEENLHIYCYRDKSGLARLEAQRRAIVRA